MTLLFLIKLWLLFFILPPSDNVPYMFRSDVNRIYSTVLPEYSTTCYSIPGILLYQSLLNHSEPTYIHFTFFKAPTTASCSFHLPGALLLGVALSLRFVFFMSGLLNAKASGCNSSLFSDMNELCTLPRLGLEMVHRSARSFFSQTIVFQVSQGCTTTTTRALQDGGRRNHNFHLYSRLL